jgi:hypothetical protein
MRNWFYRFTAVHFVVTAVTGMALYFRAGNGRPALYSDAVKEWLVMVHNGEWVSYLVVGNPFISGILTGAVLSTALVRFSWRAILSPRRRTDGSGCGSSPASPLTGRHTSADTVQVRVGADEEPPA